MVTSNEQKEEMNFINALALEQLTLSLTRGDKESLKRMREVLQKIENTMDL